MTVQALRRGSIAAARVQAPSTVTVLDLPGTAGNYASTPDSAATSILSDIDLRVKLTRADWSKAFEVLIGKWGASGSLSYLFYVQSNGRPELLLSSTGSNTASAAAFADHGFADGSTGWLRVTWDNAANIAKFYKSTDGSAWTQFGTDRALSLTGIFNSTAAVAIGADSTGASPLTGKVHYAEIRDGINGTVVASFDATAVTKLGTRNPTTAPVGGTAGGNWTMNGSAWDWSTATP